MKRKKSFEHLTKKTNKHAIHTGKKKIVTRLSKIAHENK